MSGSGSTAPVLTDPAVPTTMHGTSPAADVRFDLPAQRGDVHAQFRVGRDPPDRCGAEAAEVGGLLNPRVRFGRAVDAKPVGPNLPATPRSRTSQPAFAARAARKQTMFAMLPPLTSSPPQSAG